MSHDLQRGCHQQIHVHVLRNYQPTDDDQNSAIAEPLHTARLRGRIGASQ